MSKPKTYYERNKSRMKETAKIYYEKNKLKIKEKVKKYQVNKGIRNNHKLETFGDEVEDLSMLDEFNVYLYEDGVQKIIQAF